MATIYDVARAANVSLATVSAVVNASAYVSPGLTSRVTTAIRRLGYQPNLLARSLATQQTRTLGMIVPNIANPSGRRSSAGSRTPPTRPATPCSSPATTTTARRRSTCGCSWPSASTAC